MLLRKQLFEYLIGFDLIQCLGDTEVTVCSSNSSDSHFGFGLFTLLAQRVQSDSLVMVPGGKLIDSLSLIILFYL